MQAIANQLESKVNEIGVEVQFGSRAIMIKPAGNDDYCGEFMVEFYSKGDGK
jgi:hypothetical protein